MNKPAVFRDEIIKQSEALIFKDALKEWEYKNVSMKCNNKCICGTTILNNFQIVNNKNNIELWIGSTCIENYDFNQTLKQSIKEHIKMDKKKIVDDALLKQAKHILKIGIITLSFNEKSTCMKYKRNKRGVYIPHEYDIYKYDNKYKKLIKKIQELKPKCIFECFDNLTKKKNRINLLQCKNKNINLNEEHIFIFYSSADHVTINLVKV